MWVFIQIIKMNCSSDLWSQLIHPITSSGISGWVLFSGFIVEGTWVFGYFRDGYAMQERGNRNFAVKALSWRKLLKVSMSPNGVYPKYKDEVDTNRLATNDSNNPHLGLELRKLTRRTDIATDDFDAVPVEEHISTAIEASDSDTWSQLQYLMRPFIHIIMYLKVKVVISWRLTTHLTMSVISGT